MKKFLIVKSFKSEDIEDNLQVKIYSNIMIYHSGCYVTKDDIDEIIKEISTFTNSDNLNCYIELGRDIGDDSDIFSMNISKSITNEENDKKIDIEFNDLCLLKSNEYHFYVETTLTRLVEFFKKIKNIIYDDINEEAVLEAFSIISDEDEEDGEYKYEEFDYDVRLGREVEIQYKSDEINYFISIDNETDCPSLYNCDAKEKLIFKDYDEMLSSKIFEGRTFKEAWEDIFIACVL